jgi:hypothetical protein
MPLGLVRKVVDGGHIHTGQRDGESARGGGWMMQTSGDVFVGVDMGKTAHYAQAIGPDGDAVFDRPVPNDETAIRR